MSTFRRDRLTWTAYVMLAWFAFLQASPGLVVPHLREELDLSYATAGMHVAAFAAGSALAGWLSPLLERSLGRRRLLWSAAALLAAAAVGLTGGGRVEETVGAVLLMGLGGGLVLSTLQATLSDHHGAQRTVALAEANVAASVSYLALTGAFAAAAALDAGWRTPLLLSLLVPAVVFGVNRRLDIGRGLAAGTDESGGDARLPAAFYGAAGVLMCATAAEWCVTAWGASFIEETVHTSADTGVALMGGFFGGVLVGRLLGSRLARSHDPGRLFLGALGVALAGFAVLWPATVSAQAVVGLALLGVGVGNLYPMGLAVAVALAPGQAAAASGRAVLATSASVLLAPLAVGALADLTSLTVAMGAVPTFLGLAAAGLLATSRRRAVADRAAEGAC